MTGVVILLGLILGAIGGMIFSINWHLHNHIEKQLCEIIELLKSK